MPDEADSITSDSQSWRAIGSPHRARLTAIREVALSREPGPDELDHAGVEDFAVYRSPGALPESGDGEVRLGTIVVRAPQSDSNLPRTIPPAVLSDSHFLETQTPEWIVR